jgi:hypothetical protein
MTVNRHGSATVEFPSDREALVTRKFDAPAELVFDVLTKPEHVRVWFTDGDQDLEVCEIDLRVGGEYRYVGVFDDGVTTMTVPARLPVGSALHTDPATSRESWRGRVLTGCPPSLEGT